MLTDHQKKKIIKTTRMLAERLNLQPFKFKIDFKLNPDSEHVAEARPHYPYSEGVMTINDQALARVWKEDGWQEVRSCILHELVHFVLNPLVHTATDRFVDVNAFKDSHELVTSRITHILEPLI